MKFLRWKKKRFLNVLAYSSGSLREVFCTNRLDLCVMLHNYAMHASNCITNPYPIMLRDRKKVSCSEKNEATYVKSSLGHALIYSFLKHSTRYTSAEVVTSKGTTMFSILSSLAAVRRG